MEGSKIKFLSPSYLRCQGKGELSACLITRPSCMHLPRYSSPPRLQPSPVTQVSRGTLPTKRGSPIPSPPRQKGAISSSERVGKEPRLLRKKNTASPFPVVLQRPKRRRRLWPWRRLSLSSFFRPSVRRAEEGDLKISRLVTIFKRS